MEERFLQLLAINRALAESVDYDELIELVVDKTLELTQARACALLLADENGTARVRASRGIPAERAAAFVAPLDERIQGGLRELLAFREHDTFLGVPIIHAGQIRGLLVVHRRGAEPPDADEELVLSALADQAAIAFDHASRYRQLWEESEAAQRALESASRRKDEFLAMLSHELRNPLAAIANAHEVLRLAARGSSRLERVTAIAVRQTAHMKRLLDDLLDASRVTQDKITLDRRPVALQELVEHALQATQSAVDERRHQLRVELPPEPVVVEADADRVVQVISNLVTNAAKFTPPEGHLLLALSVEGEQALLRVEDDGRGIDADLLPMVFDLFVQAQGPWGGSEGGLGIGLSLVKRLVEMHGGTVVASSAGKGRGSEFAVRLPLAPEGVSATSRRGPGAVGVPQSRNVVLVEDNADVAELLAEALVGLGHRVRVARDGEQALLEVSREAPDVMLVDVGLPGIDGYELARRLRQLDLRPAPHLIALTGYGGAADRARAHEAGFDHHMVKPVRLDELSRVLAGARPATGR